MEHDEEKKFHGRMEEIEFEGSDDPMPAIELASLPPFLGPVEAVPIEQPSLPKAATAPQKQEPPVKIAAPEKDEAAPVKVAAR